MTSHACDTFSIQEQLEGSRNICKGLVLDAWCSSPEIFRQFEKEILLW